VSVVGVAVKGFVVAILFIVGLILGVLVAMVIPRIVRTFRAHRYASFQNDPVA
jgi:hypothetical protein